MTATANANANAASSQSQTNTNTNINTNNNDGVEKEKPLTSSSLSRPDPPSLLDEETQKGQTQKPPFQSSEIGNANTNNNNSNTNNNEEDEDEDEDEMVKQARAIALSAAMLSKQQLQHKKHTNKGGLNNILNLTSLTNLNLNMNMGMGMAVKADQELPLGDIQQRKIIEEKMKQQQQHRQQQQSDHTTMAMAMSSNPLKAVGGLAEVKEKFDGFIKEQQQKIEETFTGTHNRDRDRDRDASASLSESPIRLNSRSAEDSHSHSLSHTHAHVPYPIPMMDEKVDNLILSTPIPAPNGNANMGMSIGTNTNKDAITNTNTHTTATTNNAHVDVDAVDEDDAPIILSSIVYKRRSGYGRYSTSRAWERRRMDIKGSTIRYFKTIDPEKEPHLYDASEDDPSVQSDLNSNSRPPSPFETGSTGASASTGIGIGIGNAGTSNSYSNSNSNSNSNSIETKQHKKKDIRDFWEQAKENITKTTETITTSLTLTAQAALDPNAPRGTIDLVKEHATVSTLSVSDSQSNSMATAIAMGGSWGSPTPFGISILTKSEVKWKICFDTQKEQMQWLIALTDIVVKNTVESYNDELTKSRRGLRGGPASGNGHGIGIGIGLGNNNINSHGGHGEGLASLGGEEVLRSPPGGREDALWKTDDRYTMRNIVYGSGTGTDTKSGVDAKVKAESDPNKVASPIEVDGKMEGGDEYEMADTKFQMIYNLVNQGARSGPAISLKGNNIYLLSGFINVALYIVSAIESKWAFRFFVMAANCFFWILVTNDPDGGASASGKANDKEKGKDDVDIRPKLLRSSFLNLMESFTSTSNRTTTAPSTKTVIEDRPKIVKAKVQLPKIKEGFKPSLGSSTACVTDFSEEDIAIARKKRLTWNILPLDSVQVRSHGYLKTKKKIACPSSLYEIIGCEILNSDVRVSDFATKVELPKIAFEDDGERTWVSPDIFVISLAVPSAEPSMTRPTTDGEGFSLTVYYKMKKETRTLLRTITAPEYDPSLHSIHAGEDDAVHQRSITNAVKLWEDWCRTAPTDEKMQSRFKFIPNIHNPKEIGLPSYISKYCGKPVLIKRANVTGFLSSHPHLNAMEFGISLHPFPYLAKKALAYLKTNVFPKAIVSLSYVIEGRSDEELPEALIGDAVKVICPDPEHAFEYEDFLAGATESSPATTDPESNDQINRASENKDQ